MIFVLGGGPSLLAAPLHLLHDRFCIAVNNAYTVVPWSQVLWFGDVKWWDWHKESLRSWPNSIATCCQNARVIKEAAQMGISLISYNRMGRGLSKQPKYVSWNGSSGASAINLAYHLGAKKVVLVGFDMRRVDGKKNFHSDHKEADHDPFGRHLRAFPKIAPAASQLGLTIINATPGSAIPQFPIMSLEEAIAA